uniref:Uncharacterized protein n=1 Tax=Amphimedon queenslandica TaxID=400682 RepID=A0A1X7VSA4_AMPQE
MVLLAKEDEPTLFWWIGQASTPRLRARYWLQFAIINSIAYSVVIVGIPSLIFFIPATILAYQAVIKYDEGNEEACKTKTKISAILSVLGVLTFVACVAAVIAIEFAGTDLSVL